MKKTILLCALIVQLFGFSQSKTSFKKEALEENLLSLQGNEKTFKEVLEGYKGNIVLIDFWASWCPDCVKGLPKVKKIQTEFSKVAYLFLSLDRAVHKWKAGIEKYDIKGEHYFIKEGWKKSALCKEINLDWIPRYMLLDSEGNIRHFRAITADDPKLISAIKELTKQ